MFINSFIERNGEEITVNTDDNITYKAFNNDNKCIGHIVLYDIPEDGYYSIKDTYIITDYRKRGIWKEFMKSILNNVKVSLNSKGLVSKGQFRRPASENSWKSIERYADVVLNKRKKDFYLKDFNSFNIDM